MDSAYKDAIASLRVRADEGDSEKMLELGCLLQAGSGGVVKDERAAVRWFRRASDAGLPRAAWKLGEALMQGAGVEKDTAQAARWLEVAARANVQEAQRRLADHLMVKKRTRSAALTLYGEAARGGCPHAMWQLARILIYNLDGAGQDFSSGAYWLKRAAEAGHGDAQWTLGHWHTTWCDGLVKRDRAQARRWLTAAAVTAARSGVRKPRHDASHSLFHSRQSS